MADNSKVEIPKSLLAALGGGLILCMLALAFLLGRSSNAPAPAPVAQANPAAPVRVDLNEAQPPVREAQVAAAPVTGMAPPPPPPAAPAQQVPAVQQDNPPAPPPEQPVAAAPPPPPPPPPRRPAAPPRPARPAAAAPAAQAPASGVPAGERAAISRYLSQVSAVTAQTGDLGDPNQMANTVLQQSVNGDNSGLNDLSSKSRAALAQLRAIVPPPVAKEHYQLLIKTTQASAALVDQLAKATSSGDMGALTAISAKGQAMQADATRLQQLEQDLKAKAAGG